MVTVAVVVAAGATSTIPHRIQMREATWVAVIMTGERTMPRAAWRTSMMAAVCAILSGNSTACILYCIVLTMFEYCVLCDLKYCI